MAGGLSCLIMRRSLYGICETALSRCTPFWNVTRYQRPERKLGKPVINWEPGWGTDPPLSRVSSRVFSSRFSALFFPPERPAMFWGNTIGICAGYTHALVQV